MRDVRERVAGRSKKRRLSLACLGDHREGACDRRGGYAHREGEGGSAHVSIPLSLSDDRERERGRERERNSTHARRGENREMCKRDVSVKMPNHIVVH